ncbi:MAG: glycosyltransferase family 25 protein [Myxococcales bacterium]|nr:glycosyltransferase family 25 protein [Myxococcales bacterium]
MTKRLETYLINLGRDHHRLSYMKKILGRKSLEYSRIEAVDGSNLTSEQEEYYHNTSRRHMGKGEIGCLLSHIEAWKRIVEDNVSFGLIFEDDVHISDDFGDFIGQVELRICTESIEVHRIEWRRANITIRREIAYTAADRFAHVLESSLCGSGAYIINRPTARYLLAQVNKFRWPIDVELFNVKLRSIGYLKILQWMPALCVQDCLVEDESLSRLGFESNIGSERVSTGKYDSNLVAGLKNLLRPAYTRAWSLAIMPTGRMRVPVSYKYRY